MSAPLASSFFIIGGNVGRIVLQVGVERDPNRPARRPPGGIERRGLPAVLLERQDAQSRMSGPLLRSTSTLRSREPSSTATIS